MNTLSTRTLGHVVTATIEHVSKEGLRNLLMQSGLYDLDGFDQNDLVPRQMSSDPPRGDIFRPPLLAAQRLAAAGDRDAHEALLEVVRAAAEALYRSPQARDKLSAIREKLVSDGYEMQWGEPNLMPGEHSRDCRILPIDPDAIPVSTETTALAAELDRRGYAVAREHYRLAVKHFTEQVPTSSNAELRNMLESLIINLAVDHASYIDTGQANQGGKAIKSLYVIGGKPPAEIGKPLPEDDGGRMLQGIWNIQHPRGSHAGLSDADEARIRMQLNTALARFLLKHFPARP